ncbi:trypsin-like peptidase domain-containing protein [Streptomyces avidinii]|uniref:S1 family peptidase n=1 Tax=Streptomyces avidinii TaxID=1895 RepID=UPI003866105D|nr:trypsin-like peptidase domain-containing protein [Streptomyces avidinii]
MRRTLTMAAVAAALLVAVPGGPLPVSEAEAGNAVAPVAAGRWSAHEARAFWTAERMASAIPWPPLPHARHESAELPEPPGPVDPAAPDPEPVPGATPTPVGTEPAVPSPDAAATPTPTPTATPVPSPTRTPAAPSPLPAPAPAPAVVPRLPALTPGVGQDFDGVPVAGRMFLVKGGGAYFCTASVVSSPGRNLVLSAAHCLLGSDTQQVAFVPKYTKAKPQPYGMFPVLRDAGGRSRIWIDPRYRSQGVDRAAALDVAFAQVGPNARGVPVESVVGGNRLVTGAGYAHARVTLIGYPSSAARPRLCANRTTKFTSTDTRIPGSFLRINCTGYPGGTSGGPFLNHYDARTGTGDVVGVIGGWKTGGDKSDTSYSSYFGADIRNLYERAVAGAKASR